MDKRFYIATSDYGRAVWEALNGDCLVTDVGTLHYCMKCHAKMLIVDVKYLNQNDVVAKLACQMHEIVHPKLYIYSYDGGSTFSFSRYRPGKYGIPWSFTDPKEVMI